MLDVRGYLLIWAAASLAQILGRQFAAWLVTEGMEGWMVFILLIPPVGFMADPTMSAFLVRMAPADALATALERFSVLGAIEVMVAAPLIAVFSYHRLAALWRDRGDKLLAAGGRWRLPHRLRRLDGNGGVMAVFLAMVRISLDLALLALLAGHFGAPVPAVLQTLMGGAGPPGPEQLQAEALHLLTYGGVMTAVALGWWLRRGGASHD